MGRAPNFTREAFWATYHYDPSTGIFWSRAPVAGVNRGRELGSIDRATGYRRVCVFGLRYLAHRLAWFVMTGDWPAATVDHRDRNRDHNAWANLRLADGTQQQANTLAKAAHGLKGAHWNRFRGHWQSYIKVRGKARFLGRFETAQEAHAAYMAASIAAHGEFARAA